MSTGVGVLVIDEQVRNRVRRVVDFASAKENYYRPGKEGAVVPGDIKAHKTILGSFRCVFSITTAQGRFFRHLSVSRTNRSVPAPLPVFMIAELFGFTGWEGWPAKPPQDWGIRVDGKVVTVIQEIFS